MRQNRLITVLAALCASMTFVVITPEDASAQGRSDRQKVVKSAVTLSVTLTPDIRVQIRDYYRGIDARGIEGLPPGIRKRLARGKPLPPGIAKQVVPAGLRSRVHVPDGYRLYEVGLDVLLVEVATNIVHDVLMDVVR